MDISLPWAPASAPNASHLSGPAGLEPCGRQRVPLRPAPRALPGASCADTLGRGPRLPPRPLKKQRGAPLRPVAAVPTGDKPSTHPGVRIHLVGATFTPGQEAAADGALRAYPMLLADRTAGTLRVWRESELDHPMVRSTLMAVQHVIALRHAHQGFKRLRLAPTLQAEKSAWLQQVIGDARLRKLWDALYRDWNVPPKGPAARTRAAINKLICAPDAKLGEAALRKMGTAFNDDAAFFYWAETLARRSSSAAEQAMAAQEGYSGPIVNIRVLEACIADPFNESLLDRFYIDLMVGWREYFWANKMVAWLDTARASEQLLVLCSAGHLRPMRERLLALRPKCGLRMRSL